VAHHSDRDSIDLIRVPAGISFVRGNVSRKRIENTILIGVPLVGTLATPGWLYFNDFGWIEISAFVFGYTVIGIGVGVGLHRFLSHRSFRPKPWIAFCLAAAGSMAFQGSVLRWVADHRRHHAHTDECGDVHSPYVDTSCANISNWRGFFHAHVGWMFDDSVTDYAVYANDLLQDELFMFFHRTHWIWPVISLAAPWLYGYALGGIGHAWGCLLFAGCVRTTLVHNAVWAVNSIGHLRGYRNFALSDGSRNSALLAIITLGEGWHNNHHRFPRSAFHGLTREEIDLNGLFIRLLERLGLASEVIRVPASKLKDLAKSWRYQPEGGCVTGAGRRPGPE
jgi:stearoyl-CoA desaturase (Delta-9 desaturase)